MTGEIDPGQALDRLRREMAGPPYHQFLKPEAISVDSSINSVTIRLKSRPEFRRSEDETALHGGIVAALIDIAGHAAVAVEINRMAPTIDLRIDYLRPAGGDHLMATAKLLRAGRTVARVDIEVTDAEGRVVALGRGSFSTFSGNG